MNADEQLSYFVRLVIIIFTCGIIGLTFLFGTPKLDIRVAQSEIITGMILYNGGLGYEPGVFEENLFNQNTADNYFLIDGVDPLQKAVAITLYDINNAPVTETIVFNKPFYDLVTRASSIQEPKVLTWVLPATYNTSSGRQFVYAKVEAYYEP